MLLNVAAVEVVPGPSLLLFLGLFCFLSSPLFFSRGIARWLFVHHPSCFYVQPFACLTVLPC
jgi:hypothetical protein